MRTVYVGTTDFAAVVLERLADSAHRPRLVVSRPDSRRGRGRKVSPPPVVERARQLGIETFQPEDVNAPEALERIAAAAPEAACVCAYGAILGYDLLAAHTWLNVHPSLLPRWRGAAPIERAIEAGDAETGVAIMEPVAELDAGPVYLVRREPILAEDDYRSLSERLATLGGDLLVEALDALPAPRPQGEDGVVYAEKVDRDERALDPSLEAAALARRVRALTPHVGAYVESDGQDRLGVRRVAVPAAGDPAVARPAQGALAAADGRLFYGAGDGPLELLEIQPPGGRPMDAAAWLRGHGAALAAG
jgi:methionyl-tRNA formyltransferase